VVAVRSAILSEVWREPAQVDNTVQNLFRLGRYHLRSAHYPLLRSRSFQDWLEATDI
jgi:hypothetical protein